MNNSGRTRGKNHSVTSRRTARVGGKKPSGATALSDTPVSQSPGKNVRVPKAAELVTHALRRQIAKGELKPGASLISEDNMIQRYGVSRQTLREAIRILESEGLITVSRGARGGAIIRAPSVDAATRYIGLLLQSNKTTLSDICGVHVLIEPMAARILAEKYSDTAPDALRACIIEEHQNLDDDFSFGTAAARFRNKMIELAGISTLTLLMGMLNSIFEAYWARVTVAAGRQFDNAKEKRSEMRALETLIELIKSGDADGAESYWRTYTEAVRKAMSKWLPAATVIDVMSDK